jgi:hypothetical protein
MKTDELNELNEIERQKKNKTKQNKTYGDGSHRHGALWFELGAEIAHALRVERGEATELVVVAHAQTLRRRLGLEVARVRRRQHVGRRREAADARRRQPERARNERARAIDESLERIERRPHVDRDRARRRPVGVWRGRDAESRQLVGVVKVIVVEHVAHLAAVAIDDPVVPIERHAVRLATHSNCERESEKRKCKIKCEEFVAPVTEVATNSSERRRRRRLALEAQQLRIRADVGVHRLPAQYLAPAVLVHVVVYGDDHLDVLGADAVRLVFAHERVVEDLRRRIAPRRIGATLRNARFHTLLRQRRVLASHRQLVRIRRHEVRRIDAPTVHVVDLWNRLLFVTARAVGVRVAAAAAVADIVVGFVAICGTRRRDAARCQHC